MFQLFVKVRSSRFNSSPLETRLMWGRPVGPGPGVSWFPVVLVLLGLSGPGFYWVSVHTCPGSGFYWVSVHMLVLCLLKCPRHQKQVFKMLRINMCSCCLCCVTRRGGATLRYRACYGDKICHNYRKSHVGNVLSLSLHVGCYYYIVDLTVQNTSIPSPVFH